MDKEERIKIINKIKTTNDEFNEELFLKNAKEEISNLYACLCKNVEYKEKVYCTGEIINKMKSNPEQYRINKNFDSMAIQFIDYHDYSIKENYKHIQLYLSIYFYDDVSNNNEEGQKKDVYWNDIWIVTYKDDWDEIMSKEYDENLLKCNSCGATMEMDKENNLLKCKYCRNNQYFDFGTNGWILSDITVIK